MAIIAFNLDRTEFAASDEKRRRVSAKRECGGVEHRPPRNQLFRLANIRNNGFKRLTSAGRHAGERERRTHELQESSPRNRIQPFGRTFGKFAVHHFLEIGTARQFLQASPEFRTILLLDFSGCGGEIELAVFQQLVLLAGANLFALRLAVLFFVAH